MHRPGSLPGAACASRYAFAASVTDAASDASAAGAAPAGSVAARLRRLLTPSADFWTRWRDRLGNIRPAADPLPDVYAEGAARPDDAAEAGAPSSQPGGFRALETSDAKDKWKIDGKTAWRIALDALKAILWELDWH